MHKLRIPTQEQFAFIEIEFDGSAEDAINEYRRLTAEVKGGAGLEKKDFDEIIDLMIARKPIQRDPGILESMNPAQKWAFDIVRRSINRINYKNQ